MLPEPEETSRARPVASLAVLVLLALALVLVVPQWWAQVRAPPPYPVPAELVAAARTDLASLAVVEPLGLADYEREFFGEPWSDVDRNGCDTRNDVLAVWLDDVVLDALKPCLVVSGSLSDPYTGHLVPFVRGPSTSAEVQIDHVVALADAWRKGASHWPPERALAFANDPGNLIAVDGPANQDKGADDAADWLPPNTGFHCAYAVQQIRVKATYALGVSGAEFGALAQVLAQECPGAPAARAEMVAGRLMPGTAAVATGVGCRARPGCRPELGCRRTAIASRNLDRTGRSAHVEWQSTVEQGRVGPRFVRATSVEQVEGGGRVPAR
ncbi:HNH endonuclease family protein [Occultella gossypii]|uniref:HNH endonuclease n=1 Tax=Occultella gossypii TaxID=2800820 RepID=A0ABS7SGC5_9MICO|nr:HNH endonuclease family protein [Occultella gossypii]MBZ2199412.1 HNH endonuclease [Occultella gossypii]